MAARGTVCHDHRDENGSWTLAHRNPDRSDRQAHEKFRAKSDRLLEQLRAFLEGTGEVRFQSVADDEGRYSHLQAVLKRFAYPRLKRADKGLVLRYLGRTTRAIHGSS
jgi:hypothetical protein